MYRRVQGEVAARNVEKRHEMVGSGEKTWEEMRNILLSDTEDVPRKDQIRNFTGETVLYKLTDEDPVIPYTPNTTNIHLSLEAAPTTSIDFWPGYTKLPKTAQLLMMEDYIKALTEDGSIYMAAKMLGLEPAGYYKTSGYWLGDSNPGFRLTFKVDPVVGKDGLLTISEKDATALKTLGAIIGKTFVQEGVVINYRFMANSESEKNALFVQLKHNGIALRLDQIETKLLGDCIQKTATEKGVDGSDIGIDNVDSGACICNFGGIPTDKFLEIATAASDLFSDELNKLE